MKLRFCVSGKLRKGPELVIFNRYLSRARKIGRLVNIYPIEISEFEGANWTRFLKKLGSSKLSQLRTCKVLLNERGKKLSSKAFAETLSVHRDNGIQDIIFCIGGSDGIPTKFTDHFDESISLGNMVWPHVLVRAMLMEQVYRTCTILAGLPYHKD